MTIHITDGKDAAAALDDPVFIQQWRDVYDSCEWATPFQAPEFAGTWYRTYAGRFSPVLVSATARDGRLAGLMALARSRSGEFHVAGGIQAEYQGWITVPELSQSFPASALQAVRTLAGHQPLVFQYLPPGTPTEWTALDGNRQLCRVEAIPRPVMYLSDADARGESMTGKHRKRLNKLARLGDLRFERLTSVEEVAAVIDEIALLYDLRQGGFGGDLPFGSDPQKSAFHVALMAMPNLLHATVLRLGSQVLSAQLGLTGRGWLHLCVFAYSPQYGEHSPGVMHLRLLGQLAAKEGFQAIDMTPGGGWKDRFATDHDSVSRLTVFADRGHAVRAEVSRQAASVASKALRSIHVEPAAVKQLLERAGRRPIKAVASVLRRVKDRAFHAAELRGYVLPASEVQRDQTALASRDRISDLLTFQEFQGSPSSADFFRMAVSRLESGHHVYTRVESGRLVHWGWLAENPDKGFMDEVHQEFTYPAGSAVVYDFFTHPEARGRGLYSATIRQMMADAAAAGVEKVFVFVLTDNDPSRHVIEKAGFRYTVSLFERTVAGKTRRWRTDAST